MAEKKYNLKKNVISNQKAKELLDGIFEDLILSDEAFDDTKLKKIYKDLFYQIPKKGEEESHETVINQSWKIAHPEDEQNMDDEIKAIDNSLLNKNDELLRLTLPQLVNEHPIIPNGIFLQEGNQVTGADNPGSQRWFVQQGLKRKINEQGPKNWIKLLRKSVGDLITKTDGSNQYIPVESSPFMRFLPAAEINDIEEANENIDEGSDLSIESITPKSEQTYIYSLLKLRVWCEGIERYYQFSTTEFNYEKAEGRFKPGYWYMDTNGFCELTAQTDIDPSVTFTPQSAPLLWKTGNTLDVEISRDPILYGGSNTTSTDPSFISSPANLHYESRDPDNAVTSYPTVRTRKEWGMGNKFPGIINMRPGSRVKYKLLLPTSVAGLTNMGENSDMGYLYSLDDTGDQEDLIGYYDEMSDRGNRMINRRCWGPLEDQCFGSLGQWQDVHDKCRLGDPSAYYYLWQHTGGDFDDKQGPVTGKIYGQPILKSKKDKKDDNRVYCVYLGGYQKNKGYPDYHVFYDLENGGHFELKRKHLDNCVSGYSNAGTLSFFVWKDPDNDYINNPRLFFPGLKGHQLNWRHTDLDPDPEQSAVFQAFETFVASVSEITALSAVISFIPGGTEWLADNSAFGTNLYSFQNQYLDDNLFNPKSLGSNYENRFRNALNMNHD